MATATHSRTAANLTYASASETRACGRYLAFAAMAEEEGLGQVAAMFRSIAQRRRRRAEGLQQAMCTQDGLASDQPIGGTEDNLRAAIASELHEYTDLYSGMARTARDEGLDDIAELFETLARTGRSHTGPLQRALDTLVPPGVPTGVPTGVPSGSVGFVE